MKTSRFTDSQIVAILKQAEAGSPVSELYREHGISNATFYKWPSKFGGMDAIADGTHEGARRGKPSPQDDVCRGAPQGRDRRGGTHKKMVAPSQTAGDGAVGRVGAVSHGQAGVPGIWH